MVQGTLKYSYTVYVYAPEIKVQKDVMFLLIWLIYSLVKGMIKYFHCLVFNKQTKITINCNIESQLLHNRNTQLSQYILNRHTSVGIVLNLQISVVPALFYILWMCVEWV